ncbi:MAG TPA: hypothetical protein PK544_12335 [Spirochaetota bacterium]|nr:hypothetical protein [Spirochaetota bacterium]
MKALQFLHTGKPQDPGYSSFFAELFNILLPSSKSAFFGRIATSERRLSPSPSSIQKIHREGAVKVYVAIIAIGNSPNPIIQKTSPDIETNKLGTIIVNESMATATRKVFFAGGNIVPGAATGIEAIGAGRRAASIAEYLDEKFRV